MDPIIERHPNNDPFTPEEAAKAHGAIIVTLQKFIEEVGPQNGIERQQIIRSAKAALKDKSELPIVVEGQYYFVPYNSIFDFFNPPSPVTPPKPAVPEKSSVAFPAEDPFPGEGEQPDPMIPQDEPRKPGRPKKT